MGDITETENKFLNELLKDCITYRLTETESLEYIKTDENTDIDRGPDLLPITHFLLKLSMSSCVFVTY